ncbi:DUF397 domain-containing protein [Streptomyces sp. WMMB 322]|uniref:DUF397 domain-containing protein n=1 Tax=Streptomyces sp. WMMB 322 TaxID=1286821 RepID=UPI0006E1B25C|nr:DUF397 domain-containing protein [Streptomyces sp. WMMB 322]SCK42482.1 protein of unknown function [Streptomyces sp. WMMB 322]
MSSTDEPTWTKSSYSGSEGDSCLEVATLPDTVHIRDSKDTTRPHLILSPTTWKTFVSHAART